jgi:hypothetical protein
MSLEKAIIVDLDGTLCDCAHRRPFLAEVKPDWRSFNESMREDTLNIWCRDLAHNMRVAGFKVLLMSGRGEEYREITEDWLVHHEIEYDALFMRKASDSRQDRIVKKELFYTHVKDRYEISFVVDDRKQVVDMWRNELGLVCLHCAEGDY